jgi:hypothetical protein
MCHHSVYIALTLLVLVGGVPSLAAVRSYEDGKDFISRLGYGLTAVKTQPVHVAAGYWKQVFHLKLPNLTERETVLPTCDNIINGTCPDMCDDNCRKLTSLHGALNKLTEAMRQSIRQLVRHIFHVIPDINVKSPLDLRNNSQGQGRRPPRAPLEIVADFSRWAFGTAKLSDVAELKQALDIVKADVQVSAQDAIKVREGLATFSKLSNERMDRFHAVLQTEHDSLQNLYDNVKRDQESTTLEFNAIAIMMAELTKFISLHDQIESLALGVDNLVMGQLSPQIITPRQMHTLLLDINTELKKQGAFLCFTSPKQVYAASLFDVARSQYDLIIRLRLPYTRNPRIDTYVVQTHALPVYGKQGFATILQNPPNFILAEYATGVIGELRQLPSSNIVDISDVIWHKPNSSSCLYAILEDHTTDVTKFCTYAVRREVITPSVTKLTTGIYIVNNYTSLFSTCPYTQQPVFAQEDCMPCLVHLDCGCYLNSNGSIIVRENDCDTNQPLTSSILHGINLPLLQTFYDLTNETISGRNLFSPDELKRPTPLHLPVFGHNITQMLAADTAAGYSLEKLASSLKNDSVVFHTPAEVMLNQLMQQVSAPRSFWTFEFGSWLPWMSCASFTLTLALLFLWYSTHRRLLVLSTALSMGTVKNVTGYELKDAYTVPTATSPPSVDMAQIMLYITAQIRILDIFIALCSIALTAMLAIVLARLLRDALGRRSYLYLEVLSQTQCLQVRFAKLQNATRHLAIRVPRDTLAIRIINYFVVARLVVLPQSPKIVDTLTNQSSRIHASVIIPPWTAFRLRRLIAAGPYRVSPLLVHTHQYVYLDEEVQSSGPDSTVYV